MHEHHWFTQALSDQVRAEQARLNLNLDGLADKSGIPRATMQRYRTGDQDIPARRISDLAEAFDITVSELVARAELQRHH